MDNTTVNGIVLDDSISNCLLKLQNNRAASLAELLDDSIGFLLEYSGYFYDNSKTFLDVLATLHNARSEFLGLIPNQKGGAYRIPFLSKRRRTGQTRRIGEATSRTAESHSKLHRPELFTHRHHFTEMLQDHR